VRGRARDFERTYAFKLDYTSFRKYFSAIASYRESPDGGQGEGFRIGGFGGFTVTDALLLHFEASGAVRNDNLYPTAEPASPFGQIMAQSKIDTGGFGGMILGGGSYTFEAGPTLVMEYLYNSQGYSGDESDDFLTLRRSASEGLAQPPPVSGIAAMTLSDTLSTGLRFQRRNYLMLQYQQPQIRGVLDLVFRYTLGLDDQSSQLIPVVQYGLSNHLQVFLVGTQNFGSLDGEARTLVDYAYSFGLEIAF
jgi:hypothetical protein